MRWVYPIANGEAVFHFERNPTSELNVRHSIEPCAKVHEPLGPVIYEERTSGPQHTNRFKHPRSAPTSIGLIVVLVTDAGVFVTFPQIEGGVGKNQVYRSLAHVRQQIQAVGLKEDPFFTKVLGRNRRTVVPVQGHMWNISARRYIVNDLSVPVWVSL
jgi:hypothetical protein